MLFSDPPAGSSRAEAMRANDDGPDGEFFRAAWNLPPGATFAGFAGSVPFPAALSRGLRFP
ncbi:hypothetical protein SLNSH_19125 [Alsobacter soli]|uniref:Uncharacterized protein n=1 Tax=Alsobacter soli TaxID=2109933 RepID=A0A2T1HP33_9HYPH|nr:hypothetical protein SLNSH_19125 [Alsobacter soli]